MAKAKKNESVSEEVKCEAIEDFSDDMDAGKVYRVGDRYPKPANKIIPEERLQEMLSKNNKRKRPVIKKI